MKLHGFDRGRSAPIRDIRAMWRGFAVMALAAVLLAGCGTPPPSPVFPELTYTHLPQIRLAVDRMDIVDDYIPPVQAPHVGHLFPTPPVRAARRWAQDRLVAAGGRFTGRFKIKEASAIETPLERTRGIKGVFTTDQAERYDVAVEAILELLDDHALPVGFVSARATRASTAAEDITPNGRKKLWFDLTEAVMKDLDSEMERQISQHLGSFRR